MHRAIATTAAFAVLAFLDQPTARAADFAGAWVMTETLGTQPQASVICVLKADGIALYGPCGVAAERSRAAAGRMGDGGMTFRYHTDYNGSGVHLVYRGDTQLDGSVKGSVTSEGGKGIFQAQALTDVKSGAPVTWKVSAAFNESLRYVLLCTFKVDGQHIAGPCTVITGATLKAQGTGRGNTIALHYDTEGGGRTEYAGTLQPDGTLAGTVSATGASGRFTAEKQ